MLGINAQPYPHWDIPFTVDGQNLPFATAGGLNNPQPNEVDLNADGLLDLYVLDRTGDAQLTFLNQGGEYRYAPEYARYFPQEIVDWVLLRDFNDDGIMDIFTQAQGFTSAQGIVVFRGYYEDGHIAFERVNFDHPNNIIPFRLTNGTTTQLYVSNVDYPAIDDLDCDGDLDILTFNPSGGFVELYTNQSLEQGHGLDSLIFELEDECWGGMFENAIDQQVGLADAPGECFDQLQSGDIEVRHPGSTLLTFDRDGDGDKDLLLGDITFSTLNFLTNGGDCDQAWLNEQELDFPSDGVTAEIPIFPVSFLADVNFDGKRDLLVAPNAVNQSEDTEMLWLYTNQGTSAQPDFVFQQRDFLIGQMLDFGTGSSPAFIDYNADGLLDLVVGNEGRFQPQGEKDSRLFLFENIGTPNSPAFELMDDDYLGLSAFDEFANFTPTFGDLDSDGDLDIVVGELLGRLFYAENTAGPGNPVSFGPWQYEYMDIDVGTLAVPFLADLDRDGLTDLIIGERTGNINFFKNTGTPTEPFFEPNAEASPNILALGNINTAIPGSISGYSAPVLLDQNGEYVLATGSQQGVIKFYNQLEGNLTGTFLLDSPAMGGIDIGSRSRPALADLDNDGRYEMIIGNQRGGLSAYQTSLSLSSTTPVQQPLSQQPIRIFPNPARRQLHLSLPATLIGQQARLLNPLGQTAARFPITHTEMQLPIHHLPAGLYLLHIPGQPARKILIE